MLQSPVIQFLNKMTDLIILNALWILCCIPIFTIGASTTAMYSVLIRSIRYGDGYIVKVFFTSFKRNFKQATIAWSIILLFSFILGFDLYFWYVLIEGFMANVMLVLSLSLACILYITTLYIFPVIAKFENKLITHVKNAAAMAIGHLKQTTIILLIVIIFFYANYKTLAANVIMLFIGFALLAYILSFFFYKVFMNYMDERFDDFYIDER